MDGFCVLATIGDQRKGENLNMLVLFVAHGHIVIFSTESHAETPTDCVNVRVYALPFSFYMKKHTAWFFTMFSKCFQTILRDQRGISFQQTMISPHSE